MPAVLEVPEEEPQEPNYDEESAWKKKLKAICREMYALLVKGSPPEPCEEVQDLFYALCIPKRQQLMMYEVFHELKQGEEEGEFLTGIVKTATAIKRESVYELVLDRGRWVEDLLNALLVLGGCDEEEVDWDSFLYILLQFCSLSKVELCQALFLMILKKLDSKVHHYLTLQQLVDFYSFYAKCPVTSFNTRAIDFTRLPLRRYYVEDFCELVQRFTVLLNPTIHLQRSLQEFLPSIEFWDNHHRTEVIIRKITYDFFLIDKTRCFLWGEPPFRESCDMLAPEALGFEAMNKDQWELRTFDLHERIGAISDQGSFSRDGKLVAPPGFQYRSLKQFSVWGEQPNPEETERMMLDAGENVFINAAGFITRHVDRAEEEDDPPPMSEADKQKANEAQDKLRELALAGEQVDPRKDPGGACLRGACIDETFNPPPVDMPPIWMKRAAIAPAPRILGPDPPLWRREQENTQSAFWNSTTSFGNSQFEPMSPTSPGGRSQQGGPHRPKKSGHQFGANQTNYSEPNSPTSPGGRSRTPGGARASTPGGAWGFAQAAQTNTFGKSQVQVDASGKKIIENEKFEVVAMG